MQTSRKRTLEDADVPFQVSQQQIDDYRFSDISNRDCMTPDDNLWCGHRYSRIVRKYQWTLIALKHMDAPSVSTFKDWKKSNFANTASDKSLDKSLETSIHLTMKNIQNGDADNLAGWSDMFAAFCFVRAMYVNDQFKIVLDAAIEQEHGEKNVSRDKLMETKAFLDNENDVDLQIRCVNEFFDAVKSGDAQMALRMKDALVYPPRAQTKEQKLHEQALEIIRDKKFDDEF